MFVEIADGEFIAVDTIASVRRYTKPSERYPIEVPHWLIKTKRGESFQVSSTTGPYYNNVQELVNAK